MLSCFFIYEQTERCLICAQKRLILLKEKNTTKPTNVKTPNQNHLPQTKLKSISTCPKPQLRCCRLFQDIVISSSFDKLMTEFSLLLFYQITLAFLLSFNTEIFLPGLLTYHKADNTKLVCSVKTSKLVDTHLMKWVISEFLLHTWIHLRAFHICLTGTGRVALSTM